MDIYAKKSIMAPYGPLIFTIFIFWLIHLNRLNWTYFIAVNYTYEPAVRSQISLIKILRQEMY